MRVLARGTWRRKRRAPLQRWNGARQSPATTTPEQRELQRRAELAKPCVCVLREPEFRTVHHRHGGRSISEGGYWCRVCDRRVPLDVVHTMKAARLKAFALLRRAQEKAMDDPMAYLDPNTTMEPLAEEVGKLEACPHVLVFPVATGEHVCRLCGAIQKGGVWHLPLHVQRCLLAKKQQGL
jgi:hypothetical protein